MKSVTRDGVRLAYRVVGEGKTPVLLVHGWMVTGAVFDPLIEALDLSGVRLLIPDLRGAGASDQPAAGYELATFVEDLRAVLDAEQIGRAVVVGHSMGGQLAQLLAATYPERVAAAALLCPVPASGVPLPADAAGLFRGSGANRPGQGVILGLACKQLSDAERQRLITVGAAASTPFIEQAFDAWVAGGFDDKLAQIHAPFLVVSTDDPFLPPPFLRSAVTDRIQGARQVYLPGPGHYPQCERTAETAAILGAFLAGLR